MTQLEYLHLNQGREQPGWLRNISTNKVIVYSLAPYEDLFRRAAYMAFKIYRSRNEIVGYRAFCSIFIENS